VCPDAHEEKLKMLRTAMWVVVLALAGCASLRSLDPNLNPRSDIPLPQDLNAAVNNRFVGRSFNEVLLRYGQPSGHVPYGTNITVYQFQTSNSVRLQQPVTTDTVAVVGTADSNVGYAERTSGWQGYNQQMNCMMRVGVKPDGTVDGIDFVGQMGACQIFMP
jgi:hypothetical protein